MKEIENFTKKRNYGIPGVTVMRKFNNISPI